jgi:hypothetical protein
MTLVREYSGGDSQSHTQMFKAGPAAGIFFQSVPTYLEHLNVTLLLDVCATAANWEWSFPAYLQPLYEGL